jgi:hypothetical protein
LEISPIFPSVLLSMTSYQRLDILSEFNKRRYSSALHNLSSKTEFLGNWFSDSYTLFRGVNEFLHALFAFLTNLAQFDTDDLYVTSLPSREFRQNSCSQGPTSFRSVGEIL